MPESPYRRSLRAVARTCVRGLCLALGLALLPTGSVLAQRTISKEEAKKRAEWVEEAKALEAEVPVARDLLKAGDSTQALPITERLVDRLAPGVVKEDQASYDLLAYLHTLHALALVGEGQPEEAGWHRNFARSLSSRVADASLEAYGNLGADLESVVTDNECRSMDLPREESGPGPADEIPGNARKDAAGAAAEGNLPRQLGGEVQAPQRSFAPPPQYSDPARWARAQGMVILQTVIDRDGKVTSVCVLKSENTMFAERGAEAVRRWRFEPATLDGDPVAVYYNLTINFTLQ